MSSRGQVNRPKRLSRSARAGLVFPVSRVSRYLKKSCLNRRVGVAAPVYLSAVLEYLVAEVVELGGKAASDNKRRVITPRHLLLGIANDTELSVLLKGVTISQGGVLPHINEVLLQRKTQSTSAVKPKPSPATPTSTHAIKRPIISKRNKRKRAVPAARPTAVVHSTPKKGFTTLSEKILPGGQKLTVVQGDITSIKCDAVVHPTNGSLSLSGQCGSALSIAGGASFRSEVNKASSGTSLTVGNACISGSGALPCKHVIHVHSPSWNDSNAISKLATSVMSCLSVAEDNKLTSIGFPSIASGSNGFPKQTAAQTILNAIYNNYVAFKGSVTQVYFVLYDMESIGVYTSELARLDL